MRHKPPALGSDAIMTGRRKLLLVIYITLLHLCIIIVLLKSDFLQRLSKKIHVNDASPEITQHYKRMLIYHAWMEGNVPKDAVLFFGDSIIQALYTSTIIDRAVNFGIGGDTTFGLLQRITKYNSIKNSKAIVLSVGINDTYRRENHEILQNYKSILSKIPQGISIILNAVLPVDEENFKKRISKFILNKTDIKFNTKIFRLNKNLKELCSSLDNCHFLDSGKKLRDSVGQLKKKYHVGDGVHLNTDGYKILIHDLKNLVNILY